MMDYAWKVLLPLSLANVILTAYFAFSDWHFIIWKENNWRIWEQYIRPLFMNVYTNLYAVPVIVIVALLLLSDAIGLHYDRKRADRRTHQLRTDRQTCRRPGRRGHGCPSVPAH